MRLVESTHVLITEEEMDLTLHKHQQSTKTLKTTIVTHFMYSCARLCLLGKAVLLTKQYC